MQLVLDQPGHRYLLRGASGESALVNERTLTRSFIVAPDALIDDWAVADVASLTVADLQPLLDLQPELILVGTGATQGFPPPQTLAACLAQGVGLEAMTNAAAARTFNVLAAEERKLVAGFIIGGRTAR